MTTNQTSVNQYAPGFMIEINGSEIDPELAHSILSLKIDQELNKTNGFVIEIQDEFKAGQFKWLQKDIFKIGNPVSISIGYTNSLTKVLEGKIKNLNGSFHTGCAPTFTVEGADPSYDFLTTNSETKVFPKKRASDIVVEIARMANLDPDVQATDREIPITTKKGGTSYIKFLEQLAGENNYEFLLRGHRLRFKKEAYGETVTTIAWGKDVIRFEPKLNTTSAVTEVIVRGWDAAHKKMIEGRAKAGEETKQEGEKTTSSEVARAVFGDVIKVITDRPVKSEKEARGIAQSELNKASNNLVEATVDTLGVPELTSGVCLNIDGFGKMFSGKYYIVKATHTLDKEGYRTSLGVRRNAV